MKLPFTGGCVCGEVRYECSSRPLLMLKCHCRDCQQVSGGGYTPVVVVPLKAFKITQGALQHYATPSVAGGHNLRGFCARCGSRLTGAENLERGIIGLTASSLDDPSWFKPKMDLFVGDAQHWGLMEPDSPKHQQYMPRK
ncbi:MAG TPA: GFA family protein [Phycisphaerae bacterium]|nr:GFA family protein [Phycisphaerae bacterium]